MARPSVYCCEIRALVKGSAGGSVIAGISAF